MKAWLWAVVAIVMLAGMRLAAQEATPNVEYRLRVPTAEEYLEDIPDVMPHATSEETIYGDLQRVIFDEFTYRYPHPDKAPFEQLLATYRTLGFGSDFPWVEEREKWNEWLILSWLAAHSIDLDEVDHFTFGDHEIEVTQRDFNADHVREWLLDVESGGYTKLLVVQRNVEGQYNFVDTPLPFFASGFMYFATQSGFIEEQLFEDINTDGLPEWVLAVGGVGGNNLNHGWLYVLQWRDGRLVDLAPSDNLFNEMYYEAPAGGGPPPLLPYGVRMSYQDVDGNGTREIIIDQMQDDNWGCTWNLHRVFEWDESEYILSSNERTYDDVQGCEIRAAEEAMWVHDFQTAISHYERSFSLEPTEEYFSGDPEELVRYATVRLALVYTFVGQDGDAAELIHTLSRREADSTTLVNLISAVEANLGDSMAMCRAARDVFDFDCPLGTGACLGSPMNAMVGYTLENSGDEIHSPRNVFPSPSQAGCDLSIPLQSQLSSATFPTDMPPPITLESLGFTLLESLHFDLNRDEIDEWLIWLDIPVPALFFYSDPNHSSYEFTNMPFPYGMFRDEAYAPPAPNPFFDSEVSYEVRRLPDETIALIAALGNRYNGYDYWCPPERTEGDGTSISPARIVFALWQLDGGELRLKQEIPFCQEVTLEHVFGTDDQVLPTEIAAWTPLPESPGDVVPATYRWNDNQGIYQIVDIQRPPELIPDYSTSFRSTLGDSRDALHRGESERALEILDTGLLNPNLLESERYILLYRRALALEALNRPDEALEEYIAIYETAPESPWGMLAALHLERVE